MFLTVLETGREGTNKAGFLLSSQLGFANWVLGTLDELVVGFEGEKRWKSY